MIRKADNKFFAAIAEGTITTATLALASGTVVTDSNLPKGAVVITDLGLRKLTPATLASLGKGEQFIIVQGKGVGNPLMKSEVITKGNEKITYSTYKAAVQQKTAIGYNGTTGNLVASDLTSYFIKLRKNDNDAENRSQPSSLFAQFKTGANATDMELAVGLAKNFDANFSKQPANGYAKISIISDGVLAPISNTIGGATDVVNGSRTIDFGATSIVFAAGDLVSLAGEVYEIAVASTGTSATLTRAFNGVTASLADGATLVGAATITYVAGASKVGLVIEGIASDYDVNAWRDYYTNRFTASFSEATSPVSHLLGASEGNGVWQQAMGDEYMTYGFEGQNEMLGVPPMNRDQEVVVGNKFCVISIAWTEAISGLVSTGAAKGTVLLYAGLNASGNLLVSTVAGDAVTALGGIASPTFTVANVTP